MPPTITVEKARETRIIERLDVAQAMARRAKHKSLAPPSLLLM